MRLLAVTIAAGLALTACASGQPALDSGASALGVIDPAPPSGGTSPDAGKGSSASSGSGGSDTGEASSRPGATSTPSPVDSRCPAGLTESGHFDNSRAKPAPSGA